MNQLTTITPTSGVPSLIVQAGDGATMRFVEFFTANIRNANTRAAYHQAVSLFFRWLEERGLRRLTAVQPVHVAAYVEDLGRRYAAPTTKQHLAAIRMLFDWLVVGQVMPTNPAHAVRGPKHVVKRGKTPVLTAAETRELLDSIDTSTLVGLRDRALIALLVFSFARVSAAIGMKVEDYFPQGKRWWVRLHEKGGKRHEMPCHHSLEEYLDAYLEAAGIETEKKTALFRSAIGRTGELTTTAMNRTDVFRMIRRRTKTADIATAVCCHTFRATGITTYLQNEGTLENAQAMAAHESPRTTKLYDRTKDEITLTEVERIVI
jgi:site-specific recombinase XerD